MIWFLRLTNFTTYKLINPRKITKWIRTEKPKA